jgi:lysophospholipid acyltransferase (LPLAT)-like uncharacterized protein
MKITHPLAIRSAALLISLWLRGWMVATKIHEELADPSLHPSRPTRPKLYLFWHENVALGAYAYAHTGVAALISSHRDGELVAQVYRMLGGETIRGSSTRGGAKALRQMLQEGKDRHLAITPDGPRGPRRVIQPGAVFVASVTGMPLVPIGLAFRRPWRVKSWDRMVIPRFADPAYVVFGAEVSVPPDLDAQGLEHYRQLAQAAMDGAQLQAEQTASGPAPAGAARPDRAGLDRGQPGGRLPRRRRP